MNKALRIVVADDEPDMRDYFQKILSRLGHQVVGVAENGRDLVEQCQPLQPDLVITDIKMPEMDGIDAAIHIYRNRPIPVILVSAFHDPELIRVRKRTTSWAISSSRSSRPTWSRSSPWPCAASSNFQALRQEAADLRQALADRKIIERAKGILMKRGPMDEAEAFRRLAEACQREESQAGRDRPDDPDGGGDRSSTPDKG